MGQIINLDTWEEGVPGALTQSGQSGFLSRGYLADEPAIALVEDDETVQYAVTNRKRGVTVDADGSTYDIGPDSRHRTVVVVTDRRLLVLVGREDGDERTSIAFDTVSRVETDSGRLTGRLTLARTDDTTWQIPTATDGLEDVGAYLRDAADAWRHVESCLERARDELADAMRLVAAGEYDRALSTARETHTDIEDARSMATQFSTAHRGTALQKRPADVESERRETLAAIRVARAREAAAKGGAIARDRNYEAAGEAYENAREEYEAALTGDAQRLDDPERIRAERDHVAALVTDIEESPLRKAITADRAAVAADDTAAAVDHWETALSQYRAALESDEEAGAGLFRASPERIRERIRTVVESLTASQRALATEATRAGDWYTDATQYEAALEEFGAAADALDAALATAAESYPDAVQHLEADRAALQSRIERAEAAAAGEDPRVNRVDGATEPDYQLSATIGAVDGPTEIEDTIEPPAAVAAEDWQRPDETTARLARLERGTVRTVVSDALSEEGWSVSVGSPQMPFDLVGTREDARLGVVVADTDRIVTAEAVTDCADVVGAAGTDAVLLATTTALTDAARDRASDLGVRILDGESLAAAVESPRPASEIR